MLPLQASPLETPSLANAADAFTALVAEALAAGTLVRLVLAKPRPAASDLKRIDVRPIELKGTPQLSFVHTQATREITKNLPQDAGLAHLRTLLGGTFAQAHLFTATDETQWLLSKKGRQTLLRGKTNAGRPQAANGAPEATFNETGEATSAAASEAMASAHAHARADTHHDRPKHRFVELDRPYLTALGVTDAQARLVPAMARKWKQINKFIEVLDHALQGTTLKTAARLEVLDFGSGKGYLTFAMHDHLRRTLGLPARVTGVELRPDMVALGTAAVARLGLDGLRFDEGDVRTARPAAVDIMVALHACDTATDFAIATGVEAGAQIIMCSPCCHKELRPQLLAPHPLRPVLKHGVHLGQQAEMLTDALRAMLLEACGYEAQVFEFVALEHTHKNKMILATKRLGAAVKDNADTWREIDEVKRFYGVRDQCLETLLRRRRADAA